MAQYAKPANQDTEYVGGGMNGGPTPQKDGGDEQAGGKLTLEALNYKTTHPSNDEIIKAGNVAGTTGVTPK